MKICLISARFYPMLAGSGNSAFLLASELVKNGHEVHIFTDSGVESRVHHEHTGMQLHFINDMEQYNTGKQSDCSMEQIIVGIRSLKPDVVHVWNIMMMHLVGSLRSCIDAPVVFTYQNTYIPNVRASGVFKDPMIDLEFTRNVFVERKYNRIIATSKHYLKFALDMGLDASEVTFSYLGIALKQYKNIVIDKTTLPTELLECSDKSQFVICMPGRVVERKGVDIALRAIKILVEGNTSTKLVLTGMGTIETEYHRTIDALITSLGIREYVVIPENHIPNSNMPSLYKYSDAVLALSTDEGFGMTVLEAIASGTPVIATNSSGYSEYLVSEKNSIIVERTPEEVANAIIRLQSSAVLRESLIKSGFETANKFDIVRHAYEMEKVYSEVAYAGA